ncbi:EamA family transporter [Nakamurella sp. YIM 132087]|uniref:EamA family transporter n=1 Tax=Nakamurella alba TaxID=2665158 RepID=A0A7K1FFI4_9ACTN|nr:DMT family transporter [Nakamurella alba]MTD12881.1 EamA family transporter [Nakamurella alba]
MPGIVDRRAVTGVLLALLSAATFGTSGSFAASLIAAGWTPGAAVTWRICLAAAVLTAPAVVQMRGRWRDLVAQWRVVVLYGLLAVAGAQLFFFNAVAHLSVGVALLLEYLGVLLVVGWLWLRHGRRPQRLTVLGAALAIVGLVLVLDLTGAQRVDPVGVFWGLAAAVGLAAYFLISSRTEDGLPPLVTAWAGLTVGGIVLVAAAIAGIVPFAAPRVQVEIFGGSAPWWVPVLCLSLVAAVIAYIAGIGAARLLGPTVASFLGLIEVLAAVLFAWLMLGQTPVAIQIAGGVLILGGVVLVRIDDLRRDRLTAREPAATP